MKFDIEIDQEKAQRALTARERIGIHLLLMIFGIIFPMKYTHQLNPLAELIGELKK